jgi:hypothetical protein
MKKSNTDLNTVLESNFGLDSLFKTMCFHIACSFLNQSPTTALERSLKFLLTHFQYLRRKIMRIVENHLEELDLYNLQAIEILEQAGFDEPTDRQINTIERLLKLKAV